MSDLFPAKRRAPLTFSECCALGEALKRHKDTLEAGTLSRVEMATLLTNECGFAVTDRQITDAAASLGLTLRRVKRPPGPRKLLVRRIEALEAQVALLTQTLDTLMAPPSSLGPPLSSCSGVIPSGSLT